MQHKQTTATTFNQAQFLKDLSNVAKLNDNLFQENLVNFIATYDLTAQVPNAEGKNQTILGQLIKYISTHHQMGDDIDSAFKHYFEYDYKGHTPKEMRNKLVAAFNAISNKTLQDEGIELDLLYLIRFGIGAIADAPKVNSTSEKKTKPEKEKTGPSLSGFLSKVTGKEVASTTETFANLFKKQKTEDTTNKANKKSPSPSSSSEEIDQTETSKKAAAMPSSKPTSIEQHEDSLLLKFSDKNGLMLFAMQAFGTAFNTITTDGFIMAKNYDFDKQAFAKQEAAFGFLPTVDQNNLYIKISIENFNVILLTETVRNNFCTALGMKIGFGPDRILLHSTATPNRLAIIDMTMAGVPLQVQNTHISNDPNTLPPPADVPVGPGFNIAPPRPTLPETLANTATVTTTATNTVTPPPVTPPPALPKMPAAVTTAVAPPPPPPMPAATNKVTPPAAPKMAAPTVTTTTTEKAPAAPKQDGITPDAIAKIQLKSVKPPVKETNETKETKEKNPAKAQVETAQEAPVKGTKALASLLAANIHMGPPPAATTTVKAKPAVTAKAKAPTVVAPAPTVTTTTTTATPAKATAVIETEEELTVAQKMAKAKAAIALQTGGAEKKDKAAETTAQKQPAPVKKAVTETKQPVATPAPVVAKPAVTTQPAVAQTSNIMEVFMYTGNAGQFAIKFNSAAELNQFVDTVYGVVPFVDNANNPFIDKTTNTLYIPTKSTLVQEKNASLPALQFHNEKELSKFSQCMASSTATQGVFQQHDGAQLLVIGYNPAANNVYSLKTHINTSPTALAPAPQGKANNTTLFVPLPAAIPTPVVATPGPAPDKMAKVKFYKSLDGQLSIKCESTEELTAIVNAVFGMNRVITLENGKHVIPSEVATAIKNSHGKLTDNDFPLFRLEKGYNTLYLPTKCMQNATLGQPQLVVTFTSQDEFNKLSRLLAHSNTIFTASSNKQTGQGELQVTDPGNQIATRPTADRFSVSGEINLTFAAEKLNNPSQMQITVNPQ